ncbi:formate dehydrogenase accessory sulfurtransferase FdhD [Curvibacter sp. CHRR-16]|uniref:formate dehydrogenase accessory sulfurtransferase FdhD n=1 Tax=Curvibacter sp. CHRR-16 TaxID=2835872 RepID=UPI001BDA82EF|nr:formate dehydrogenase accessory sulfurtransferase FdhD [Curvibacter sp. CHRR-16]MBT0569200.1 formate dehydrogenase accessory sulfurtransferase FdhD [Curvibacter sp. CHRR-16]
MATNSQEGLSQPITVTSLVQAQRFSLATAQGGVSPVPEWQPVWVAEEVPVALEFNGISHAVMLATPQDLEDFALGFSLSEGLIDSAADLLDVELVWQADSVVLQLRITARCEMQLKERRRTLAGRTGCGLCGTDSLDQVCRPLQRVPAQVEPHAQAMVRAQRELAAAQTLQQQTGGVHAAAWCSLDGALQLLREDVGRHNALDKVIGALARTDWNPAHGFFAVTSRASFEMVQKTAQAGVGLLAAVSAPTAMAIRLAQRSGVVLAGFVREDRITLYTGF